MRVMGRTVSLAALLMVVVIALTGFAQAADGSIQVTVLEKVGGQDEPVAFATVFLERADGSYPATAQQANVNGQVLFAAVPAGSEYVVRATMAGYGEVRRDDVSVIAGQTTQVVVALTGEITEEVEVTAQRDVVDLEATETTTTISDDFFADLPVLGREYQNVLTLAPGFSDNDNDGNPNVHGSRARDFQMSVDGVNNVDPLTGQFMSFITPDAIEEIEIVDSGADASFGGAVGGYGKIRIKDGGNEFEGSASLFFRDSTFDNDRAGGRDPLDYGLFQPSVFLSGPIVRDKVWFVLNHEYLDYEEPVNLVGGEDFVRSQESMRSLDKITWIVDSRQNKLQLQYSADPLKVEPAFVNSLIPPDSGAIYEQGGPTFSLKWIAPYSATLFWEATAARQETEIEWSPYNRNALNECVSPRPGFNEDFLSTLNCSDSNLGGRQSGAFSEDQMQTRQRWTYSVDGEKFFNEWLGGSHRMKFGMNVQRVLFQRDATYRDTLALTSLVNPNQLATGIGLPSGPSHNLTRFVFAPKVDPQDFSSVARLQDESRGNFYALYWTDAYQPLDNLSINLGLRWSREEIEGTGYVPFDPRAERAAWDEFLDDCVASNPGADPGLCMALYGGIQNFTVHQLDGPRINPNGSIAGCNFDSVVNQWQCNVLAPALFQGQTISYRAPETFNIVNNNLAPRASVSWDPNNDGKTKVFANWGRFFGQTILLPFLFENGPDIAAKVNRRDVNGFILGTNNLIQSAFSANLVDRNIRSQHTDEWQVGFEREVAPETSMRVRYLNRRTYDQLQDVDLNHIPVPYDSVPTRLPDGRRKETGCLNLNGFADCYGLSIGGNNPDGEPDLQIVSPFYSNVYRIGNLNSTQYDAFIVEVNRRFYQNWELGGSYVWSKAIGDADDFATIEGDDITNQQDERGFLSFDVRHVVKLNGRMFVPRWGGFRLGGAFAYQSGTPYSIIDRRDALDYPTELGTGASGTFYGRSTFQVNTFRQFYPTGKRNDQRNTGYWTFDINFQKEFMFKDVRSTFQFDIFNLLNDNSTVILAVVRQPFSVDPVTGRFETTFQTIAAQRAGRQFQLGFKLNF